MLDGPATGFTLDMVLGATVVPEPRAALLLVLGGIRLLVRRSATRERAPRREGT